MIISWYRSQKQDFGTRAATSLLCRVIWRRACVIASNKLLRSKQECPCCGWEGRRFFDYIEMGYSVRNCACPACDSHPRHRELFLWLRDEFRISEKDGTALVFAPEKAFSQVWHSATGFRAYNVDLEPSRSVDVLADLMNLPFASEIADLIWCHHVLQQVEDDRVALNELHRVLRSYSGELIVSVGESTQEKTSEFGFANKAVSGNRRAYGADFVSRLTQAGFQVQPLVCNLSGSERRKYGVRSEPFYRCTKSYSAKSG